jgi:adenylosuccinate synthase
VDLSNFLECCDIISHSIHIEKTYGLPKNNYSHIFEGSQGLLLDKNIGFFPHVTRANTGTQNLLSLLGHETLSTYLVTRAYQTRHGDGPFSNEAIPHNISKNPNETNITNTYQGALRIALLDVSLLEYAINKDDYLRTTKNKSLVITCLDHIQNEHRFTYQNAIIYCKDQAEFVKRISNILNISNVYISSSEDSKDIHSFSG